MSMIHNEFADTPQYFVFKNRLKYLSYGAKPLNARKIVVNGRFESAKHFYFFHLCRLNSRK